MSFKIGSPAPEKHLNSSDESDQASNFFLLFLAFPFFLTLFGLIILYSTSYDRGSALFIKQLIWAITAMATAFVVLIIGYKRIMELSLYILILVAFLLIIPRFFPPVKGAYRWIKLPGGFSIQPSEFAKIAVVLFLARFCARRQMRINKLKNTLICLAVLMFFAMLVAGVGKDLGTTFLICFSAWALFWVAGMRLLVLIGLPLVLIPTGLLYLQKFDPERWSRINIIFNPESDPEGSGYQLLNSLLALGSGGFTGLGFTESKMKAYYLPEAHTDFILAIAGEEFGFLGLMIVILFYIGLFIVAIMISIKAKTRESAFLAFGLGTLLSVQAMINIGVICGRFPTKGMPAPFISYGGSNILAAWIAVALILSVLITREQNFNNEFSAIKINTKT